VRRRRRTPFWDGLAKPIEPSVFRRVTDFDPERWGLSRVEARRLDRFSQFGLAASADALADAGLLSAPAPGRSTGATGSEC
jgi:3-oxoacyl-(acyl-carrier-protein) synthase